VDKPSARAGLARRTPAAARDPLGCATSCSAGVTDADPSRIRHRVARSTLSSHVPDGSGSSVRRFQSRSVTPPQNGRRAGPTVHQLATDHWRRRPAISQHADAWVPVYPRLHI